MYQPKSISTWLRNIRDAQYVITDSFHGTVFSILFHKQFISINNKKRGSARFESLLSSLGLLYRLHEEEKVDATSIITILNKKINYDIIESKLSDMRTASLTYIRNIK